MHKLWIVTKNEFYRYFISPLAYVYLLGFLLLNSSFAIYFGHFFDNGQADLTAMFAYQPWIYLLFIPGISMRLWAEEFRTKTILQLMTMPISVNALVWGKFLAAWLFCALALLLTFPFWITVNLLGSPDNAVICISYIGSFILAGCMLSISQTMSALTKNQVIALVLSVIANLIFFLSGIEYVLGFFRSFASVNIIDMIASFSFLTHFATISSGLLEARDIVFFASLILLFNFTTVLIISFKTSGTTPWLKSRFREYYIAFFILLLGAFCGLNLLANNWLRRYQIDFTQEKLFTLTDSSIQTLQNLPEPIHAKLYYSPILGERNAAMRILFDNVRLLLQQYAIISKGNFSFQILNPEPLSDIEDRAINDGLQPFPIIDNNTNAYFGMTITDAVDKKRVIPFFPLERAHLLEQDITKHIYLLNHQKKTLGIITSLPMFDDFVKNVAVDKWEIIRQLEDFYKLKKIDNDNPDLSGIDALLIAHPQKLSPTLEQNISAYTKKGGKTLALFDLAAEAPSIFSPAIAELSPSDFGTLPAQWGVEFHSALTVADLENSSVVDAGSDPTNPIFTQDLLQFYISGNGFNREVKETSLLKKMLMSSVGVFTPTTDAPTYFIPLLKAGETSALISSEVVYRHIHPNIVLRNFKADNNPKIIAARLIGKTMDNPYDIIVIGDTDFLYDSFWTVSGRILNKNYFVPLLDNGNFVLNALDSLLGNYDLLSLRGKSASIRLFPQLERQRKLDLQQFSIKEAEIFQEINKTKKSLDEIWAKRNFEERNTFTPDELSLIANIRQTMDHLRKELYQIRNQAQKNQNKIRNRVLFYNIYLLPLLFLFGWVVWKIFKQSPQQKIHPQIKINRPFVLGALITATLLGLGIWSNTGANVGNTEELIGQPLFAKLPDQINDITQITLTNHDQKLVFKKDNGIWTLQGYPHFYVYQKRIRSFLSALMEASFYEKKSNKMEHLGLFGLTPINADNSSAVRIELATATGKNIVAFEVGKYDLDLGRGSRGAYIKFDNRFQVWLVAMDLIDLSLTPESWTFSSIWNLRFGRIAAINNATDIDYNANITKYLLNTYFTNTTTTLNHPQLLQTLNITSEGNNYTTINFYRSDNKIWLSYEFRQPITENSLQSFAECAKGIFYQISDQQWEKIKNAILNPSTSQSS